MDDGVLALEGRDLLQRYTRVAMVGLSANPSRPSYRAAVHLLAYGYDVTPVNPTVDEVLGIAAVPTLAEARAARDRRRLPAAGGGARRSSTRRSRSARRRSGCSSACATTRRPRGRARPASPFVQDRCIKMEHCRWFGGLNWVGLATGVVSSRREETARAHAR